MRSELCKVTPNPHKPDWRGNLGRVCLMLQNWEISWFADGIEDSITDEILAPGGTKANVLLAFHSFDVRSNTGNAIE
jgi:hypothetical protein